MLRICASASIQLLPDLFLRILHSQRRPTRVSNEPRRPDLGPRRAEGGWNRETQCREWPAPLLACAAAAALACSAALGIAGAILPAWHVRRLEPYVLIQAEAAR
jgi:hypothetical protein